MSDRAIPRLSGRGGAVALAAGLALALTLAVPPAGAAGPPVVGDSWASAIFNTDARLSANVNPNDLSTGYHFDYISEAAYNANPPGDRFDGAARIPSFEVAIGSGGAFVGVTQLFSDILAPDTVYHYRIVATNSAGTTFGPDQHFATFPQPAIPAASCPNATARSQQNVNKLLIDCRAYEMVSPVDKNGGQVDPPGALAGGGVLQAAAQGGLVTYGSAASFGSGAQGAPPASQYLALRGSGDWSAQNVTVPIFAGSFGIGDEGVPYRLFSGDLSRGLLLSGRHCRGDETDCPVANPRLSGTDAPAGYQNYYLRTGGGFEALLGAGDVAAKPTAVAAEDFDLRFAGASADLSAVALSTCAALTPGATEVPGAEGCDPGSPNLYLHSGGSLSLVNATPPATLAAAAGAVSAGGSRVYWTDGADLYLRDGAATKQADADAGGGGTFEAASANGSVAYFTKAGHLWRYLAASDSATDITPSGGVSGVLGASADGAAVYFQDGAGIQRWQSGSTSEVAPGAAAADPSSFPPASGTARVSADGAQLLFVSEESLTGYDNTDLDDLTPDSQVFLYDDAGAGSLRCVSCNPSGGRPIGPSGIPGATQNGIGPEATTAYKPRVLAAGGDRVYFNSSDALVLSDINDDADVYQWEAQGTGTCNRFGGCVSLISSGLGADGALFVDASASGGDVFFLTARSLSPLDLGAVDLYDARTGGGFPLPPQPIVCEGDECQVLPQEPVDPTLTTLLTGLEEPPIRYFGSASQCSPAALARNARKLKRRSRAFARRSRRARNPRQRRKLRVRAGKLAKNGRRTSRAARRCARGKRSPARRVGSGGRGTR